MHTALAPEQLLAHSGFVRRLAHSLLGDEHAAEDVFQDTARVALERPPRLRGKPRPWLARVARNFALRHRREEARRNTREQVAARPEAQLGTGELAAREEILENVVQAVLALAEPYRSAVLLRFYEDLPPREIARRQGVPVETVNTRLKRALAKLRAELGEEGRDWREHLALLVGVPSGALRAGASGGALASLGAVKVAAVAGVLVAAVAAVSLLRPESAAGERASVLTVVESADGSQSGPDKTFEAPTERNVRTPIAAAALRTELSGRVLDERGEPVAGAQVSVVGDEDPFEEGSDAPHVAVNSWPGRTVLSDDEGRWRADLRGPGPVFVYLWPGPGYEVPGDTGSRWVDAPASDVDFAVIRHATATLNVHVVRGSTGEALDHFRAVVREGPERYPAGSRASLFTKVQGVGGTETIVLRCDEPIDVLVELLEPRLEPPPSEALRLSPNESREVVLTLPVRSVLHGLVVDREARPVPSALVYFGDVTDARGDEPFKPFRPERIFGGVQTDDAGRFALEGDGPFVTAWCEGYSPVTVATAESERIVLPPRSSIHARLVDASGAPQPGVTVKLDSPRGEVEAVTSESGELELTDLEAGGHGLFVGRELLTGVRLAPGVRAEVELVLDQRQLELELVRAGEPFDAAAMRGLVFGLGETFSLFELLGSGSRFELVGHPRPGEYLFLTREGQVAPFEVRDGRGVVELGTAELTVRTRPDHRVQVVPAGSDALTRLLAARLPVRADEGGIARFHVLPGRYALVERAGLVLAEVNVPAEGARLELE